MRSHYQASVGIQAHKTSPILSTTTEMGWYCKNGQLLPRLLSPFRPSQKTVQKSYLVDAAKDAK